MSRLRATAAREAGFTLIEVVVSAALGVVALLAILGALDAFTTGTSEADSRAEAQDTVRSTMRSMVSRLREARVATGQTAPVPAGWAPSRADLVFATYVGNAPGWVRYCTATGADGRSSLVHGQRAADTYAAPGACAAGNTANGWTHGTLINRTVQAPTRLFDYTSSTCSGASCLPAGPDVATVGIRLSLRTAKGNATRSTVLHDAVSFRNRSHA